MFEEERGEHVEAQHLHQHHNKCNEKAEPFKAFDTSFPLAAAYVPFQYVQTLYSPEEGLVKGTIFPELYRPYQHSCQR